MPKIYNPRSEIQIIAIVGNPAGFGADKPRESIVTTVWAERMDRFGSEIGSEGLQYFKSRTQYKVKSDITIQINEGVDELKSSFGSHAFGSQPFGAADFNPERTYGSQAKVGYLVYDIERKRRYKIVGITQTTDDRFIYLTCEDVSA